MIEAISQWLQQIILLVLIATILDMLLPNSSIQRYVKFVMALLILLSMISPVIHWAQKDLSIEKLYLRMMDFGEEEQNWSRFKAYSEQLMKENDEQTIAFVKDQLSTLIAARVEERYGAKAELIEIDFEEKNINELSYPVISSVQLVLDKDSRNAGQEERSDLVQIEPVEPIAIDVSGKSSSHFPQASSSPQLSAAERKLLNDVVDDVALMLEIERSQVRAKMKGKAEEGS